MVSPMNQIPSLGVALAQLGRRASTRRLSLDVGAGFVAVALVVVSRPAGWILLLDTAVCVSMFGVWGLAERLLYDSRPISNRAIVASLLILRTVAIVVGIAASLLFLFGAVGSAMGTWTH